MHSLAHEDSRVAVQNLTAGMVGSGVAGQVRASPAPEEETAAVFGWLKLALDHGVWLGSGPRMIRILRYRSRGLHLGHLGQFTQLRPFPAQFLQHTVVKLILLFATLAQFCQVGVIQTGPVFSEGLCTVPLNLPEELQCTLIDLPSLVQAFPGVLLLPPTQHELFVGLVTLRAIVVGSGFQHRRGHVHLLDSQLI
uniref:Uncharacterized protein n=1 Tax=Anguilla anguilla TaxID=7936 RepID=A0A0E9WS40_ANGAN